MHLVESAPFNKGKEKIYSGVPGNLVAFACKLSFQRGNEGNIAFISKTQLIDHLTVIHPQNNPNDIVKKKGEILNPISKESVI